MKASKLYQKRGAANREWAIWTVSWLIVVIGLLKAGYSEHHLFWLMVWPVPIAIACTICVFVRQGFHFKDGLLVLGRNGVLNEPFQPGFRPPLASEETLDDGAPKNVHSHASRIFKGSPA